MYNGQPPFRPPGNLPPFPPNFNPNAPPPSMPPFRPPGAPGAAAGAFVPPPFPPNFPPGAPPPGFATPPGARPPPGQASMYPPRPAHPGLGSSLPPAPGVGLPPPPIGMGSGASPSPTPMSGSGSSSSLPNFKREVKTTSVFVGSIAPGITDEVLQNLLNACGPLHELKRPTGANGKLQTFGFALFESPEVVMRCIRCLNGVELPDQTPEGMSQRKPPKPLLVKVDDKTRAFLEEFEQTLGRSDDDEQADAVCRKAIAHIVARLTDPNAPHPDGSARPSGSRSPITVVVPAHLQDLKEGDLPEEQRVAVLDQIAVFRENAARREREKKAMEEEKERFKAQQAAQGPPGRSGVRQAGYEENYGYGNRAFPKGRERDSSFSNQSPQQQQQQQQQQNGSGPSRQQRDPQGYGEPIAFAKAQAPESKEQSDRTDEEEEMLRQQRIQRDKGLALRERERRVEERERRRIDALNRELSSRKQHAEFEERHRTQTAQYLVEWDDDEKAERGKELFFADRQRWRAHRQQARMREYQDDVRDRQREEDELKALEAESEEFLQKQLAELAALEEEQKKRGLLTEDAAPIKLALSLEAGASEPVKEEKKPDVAPKPRPAVAFDGDEDEEVIAEKKKKRTLVKLEYEGGSVLSEAEQLARRNAKLLEIRTSVPKEKEKLWSTSLDWSAITDSLIASKLQTFVINKITEFLGEPDDDLVDFVMENIRDHKQPDDFAEGLEPILAEEATAFTIQLWRLLIFESLAYAAGLETGSMMV